MGQLFAHMGRQSGDSKLFTKNPMMQNLMDIEKATGGERWLRAVDDELKRQKKTVELREGKSIAAKLFAPPNVAGETSGPLGFGGFSQVYINPEARGEGTGRELKGRNPYVQSLLNTLKHELGGHVADRLTPSGPAFNFANLGEQRDIREETAQSLSGDVDHRGNPVGITPRAAEVQQYLGIMPKPGEEY